MISPKIRSDGYEDDLTKIRSDGYEDDSTKIRSDSYEDDLAKIRSDGSANDLTYNLRKLSDSYEDYLAYRNLMSQLTLQYRNYDYGIYQRWIVDLENDSNSLIYLYENNRQIIGTIKVLIEKKFYNEQCYVGHIEDVVVDNCYRGQGYGRNMVQMAIKLCQEKGCYKIVLSCNDQNVGFYKKLGLTIEGHHLCLR